MPPIAAVAVTSQYMSATDRGRRHADRTVRHVDGHRGAAHSATLLTDESFELFVDVTA